MTKRQRRPNRGGGRPGAGGRARANGPGRPDQPGRPAQPARPNGQRPRGAASGRPGSRAGQPLPARSFYTPGASGTRQAVERSSARPLAYLQQMPRWLPPLAVLALLVTGLAVPGWIGAVALVLVAAFLGWLGYMSWPTIAVPGRLLRISAVACMLAFAVVQAGR